MRLVLALGLVGSLAHASVAGRMEARTIFLNKGGVTVTPGANDARRNTSSLVDVATTIPAWEPSAALWSETVACLRELFTTLDVAITETDPGSTPHVEAVFGGTPELLGRAETSTGVSPLSCGGTENAIVFVFTHAYPRATGLGLCEAMAHEIGHSYGLDHELVAASAMSYLPYAGKRSFTNIVAECGESIARPCGPAGKPSCGMNQNSYATLIDRIGPASVGDTIAPSVMIDWPADGDHVDDHLDLGATILDDSHVALATLSIDDVTVDARLEAPWIFSVPLELDAGTHTVKVTASDGAQLTTATISLASGDVADDLPSCAAGGNGSLGSLLLLVLGLVVRAVPGVRRR